MQIVKKEEAWDEENPPQKVYPDTYTIRDLWTANVDLLKNLLTNPKRAMEFPFWIYLTLFLSTLIIFSTFHSTLVILTSEFASYELITFVTGVIRIFSANVIAILIAIPGVVLLWVITPQISFVSTFKRFLFYYETVILFSLLGEIFFCKFIIDSSMKIQPLVIILAGALAINSLQKGLENEPNIQLTRFLIIGILLFSYLQAFLIVDDLIPYYLQDNINSPITIFIKRIFEILFQS
ncbi:MAG: hypothetical protein ACFFDT_16890 [Candidatus Hodarchaeota archaeon]